MSKVSAFLLSIFITLGICLVGCKATADMAPVIPLKTKDTAIPVLVAEEAPPPGKILIESDKVLSYQLRHKYTLSCGEFKYGVIVYQRLPMNIEATLLSGQKVNLPISCEVKIGEPLKSIYTYKREVQLE